MREYIAKRGERLDSIVFREYGTVEKSVLNRVLEANAPLLHKTELDAFDKVYLPEVVAEQTEAESKGKALW